MMFLKIVVVCIHCNDIDKNTVEDTIVCAKCVWKVDIAVVVLLVLVILVNDNNDDEENCITVVLVKALL